MSLLTAMLSTVFGGREADGPICCPEMRVLLGEERRERRSLGEAGVGGEYRSI